MTPHDLQLGETINHQDNEHNRRLELELDEFDGIYRVTITHQLNGADDDNARYHFTFEDETRLDQFLVRLGLSDLKKSAAKKTEEQTAKEIMKDYEEGVGWE